VLALVGVAFLQLEEFKSDLEHSPKSSTSGPRAVEWMLSPAICTCLFKNSAQRTYDFDLVTGARAQCVT
jgi:hypothetical protein